MKALLIVDVQNDFLPGGALPVPGGDEIIPFINALQKDFAHIIATKDWHPIAHVSFAIQHGKKPYETIYSEGKEHVLWPVHCVQGTYGAEFPKALEQSKIEKIIYKGDDALMDSYSAFFDNGRKRSLHLAEYLEEKSIDEIYVVGLATDYCVKFTVLDALSLKIKTYVIRKGCRGIDPSDAPFQEMEKAGAIII